MIPNSVSAVDVYIKRGKIPNLYNGESSQNVSQEDACGYETALYILNERVIAPDKIYEDKIVDKLQIFNFFSSRCSGIYSITPLNYYTV